MKTSVYMTTNATDGININRIKETVKSMLLSRVILLSELYSSLLEEKVNVKQTLLLLNAQIAFLFTVFPVGLSMIMRALFATWFVVAVVKCKHCGLNTKD